jgi:hypothetical protein
LAIVLFVPRFTVCNYPYSIFKLKQYNGQKCEDTIGVITNCKSRDKQYNGQKCEDTIGVITNCKSKDKQYNGQKLEDTIGVITIIPIVSSSL